MIKKVLAKLVVAQSKVLGFIFIRCKGENLKCVGKIITDSEYLTQLEKTVEGMTLFPALPGSKRFNHNLKYSDALGEIVNLKCSQYCRPEFRKRSFQDDYS